MSLFVPLGSVAELINGDRSSNYPSGDDIVQEGILFLNTKNISNNRLQLDDVNFISHGKFDSLGRGKLQKNDLIITLRGTLGSCCIFDGMYETGFINAQMMIIRTKEAVCEKYLLHYLISLNKYFKQIGSGSAVPQLTAKQLEDLKIPLPPLEEQKRITAILDKAEALCRKREKAIALTDNLLRSIFLDMFGDPVANPKDWKVEQLKNLSTKISSGSTPVGGSKVYVEEGTPFLRSQNVWRRRLELDDVVYIDEVTHRKMNKTSLKNKDILITKTGRINTENSSLGRAAMFLGEDGSANINGHVYLIRPKPEAINEFILYIITTKEYRDYIRSVCVGGIDKRQINKLHLEQFPIIAPPVEAQQQFIEYIQAIEKQKETLNRQLELANNMFSSLTQQAFNGELTKQTEAA